MFWVRSGCILYETRAISGKPGNLPSRMGSTSALEYRCVPERSYWDLDQDIELIFDIVESCTT